MGKFKAHIRMMKLLALVCIVMFASRSLAEHRQGRPKPRPFKSSKHRKEKKTLNATTAGTQMESAGQMTKLDERVITIMRSAVPHAAFVGTKKKTKPNYKQGELLSRVVAVPFIYDGGNDAMLEQRSTRTAKMLHGYGLSISPVAVSLVGSGDKEQTCYQNVRRGLERCASLTFDMCLLLEDDAVLHPDLQKELEQTVSKLPGDWRALHLCPGFSWGRDGSTHTDFHVHALEGCAPSDPETRIYTEWPGHACHHYPVGPWVGGPVAMLLNREGARSMLKTIATWDVVREPIDVVLSRRHGARDFIAAEPQLCHEENRGSSFG